MAADPFFSSLPSERQIGQLDELAHILDAYAMEDNHLAAQLLPLFAQALPSHRQRLIQRFMAEAVALRELFASYADAWKHSHDHRFRVSLDPRIAICSCGATRLIPLEEHQSPTEP